MGKQSRRHRKQLREKRDHAEDHGLPVGELPQARQVALPRRGVPLLASETDADPATTAQIAPTATVGAAWSNWPLSIKLVLGGILLLVAIGLYRRCGEVPHPDPGVLDGTNSAVRGAPVDSLVTELPSGSVSKPLAAPAASPE